MNNPFQLPGTFLKGNLHTHTTNSDGELAPQEAADLYRENGDAFLAITDHGHLTATDEISADGLTLLPGMELHPRAQLRAVTVLLPKVVRLLASHRLLDTDLIPHRLVLRPDLECQHAALSPTRHQGLPPSRAIQRPDLQVL